jgi:hypothetical protein
MMAHVGMDSGVYVEIIELGINRFMTGAQIVDRV